MIASQEHAVVCSVLVEAWAPCSGKNPLLSHFEWRLIALAIRVFRPSSRVGLVWERGARVAHPPNTRWKWAGRYISEDVDGRIIQVCECR
jgi:hypothetical protein